MVPAVQVNKQCKRADFLNNVGERGCVLKKGSINSSSQTYNTPKTTHMLCC